MKTTALLCLCALALSIGAFAQTTTPTPTPAPASTSLANLYAGGISFNNSGSPAIAGTALYAHSIGGTATYAFTAVDALPNTLKPFTVTTDISAGVAQKLFSLGSVPIFVPTSAGVSFQGSNTGWAWSTGGLAAIRLNKTKNWYLCPTVRVAKSSVSNGTGYQPIVGLLLAWGQ